MPENPKYQTHMNSRIIIAKLLAYAALGASIGGFFAPSIPVTVRLLMLGSVFPLAAAAVLADRWDEVRAVAKGDYDYY